MSVQERIKQQIQSDKIVLYMKGTPTAPLCGFSARSTQLLGACGARFTAIDVLTDPERYQIIFQLADNPPAVR